MTTFIVNEIHIALLQQMYVDYDEYTEFGAPAINPKRPYGNSNVYQDIAEIMCIEPEREEDEEDDGDMFAPNDLELMIATHKATAKALQIFLHTGVMEPGIYTLGSGNRWSMTI